MVRGFAQDLFACNPLVFFYKTIQPAINLLEPFLSHGDMVENCHGESSSMKILS
jgi:hypothetical protein